VKHSSGTLGVVFFYRGLLAVIKGVEIQNSRDERIGETRDQSRIQTTGTDSLSRKSSMCNLL
jgi:hypothetical protein